MANSSWCTHEHSLSDRNWAHVNTGAETMRPWRVMWKEQHEKGGYYRLMTQADISFQSVFSYCSFVKGNDSRSFIKAHAYKARPNLCLPFHPFLGKTFVSSDPTKNVNPKYLRNCHWQTALWHNVFV